MHQTKLIENTHLTAFQTHSFLSNDSNTLQKLHKFTIPSMTRFSLPESRIDRPRHNTMCLASLTASQISLARHGFRCAYVICQLNSAICLVSLLFNLHPSSCLLSLSFCSIFHIFFPLQWCGCIHIHRPQNISLLLHDIAITLTHNLHHITLTHTELKHWY